MRGYLRQLLVELSAGSFGIVTLLGVLAFAGGRRLIGGTYGFTVLPLDLAAGALLGWQHSVTGSWKAPALTHALANLVVLL